MHRRELDRRRFIKRSAAGAAALAFGGSIPRSVLGANDRIRVGLIGCGNRGDVLMDVITELSAEHNVELAALCDVWTVNLERAVDRLAERQRTKPVTATRYGEILARRDIDAVFIASPDFSHGPILIDALEAGKDVYVEKPMSTEMLHANHAVKLVRERGAVVQVGTQFRSEPRHQAAAEILRTGILGQVTEIETAYHDNKPRWKRDYSNVEAADVDWQQFLMHLPDEPFDPSRFRQWQLYHDFTIGTVGLLGTHRIDVAHWFMNDPIPASAIANGGVFVWKDGREHADTVDMVFSYPSDWILEYSTRLGNNFPVPNVRMYGTRGTFDTTTWEIRGEGGGADALEETTTIAPIEGNMDVEHVRNWIECMRSRETPNAPVSVGYAHSVAGILGYRSLQTGDRYVFDADRKDVGPGRV